MRGSTFDLATALFALAAAIFWWRSAIQTLPKDADLLGRGPSATQFALPRVSRFYRDRKSLNNADRGRCSRAKEGGNPMSAHIQALREMLAPRPRRHMALVQTLELEPS
jgi:hypothetical protein